MAELNIDHSERVIDGLFGQLHEPKEGSCVARTGFFVLSSVFKEQG